jgi:putative oxidoreductase
MRALEGIHPGWGITAVRVAMGIILIVAGYMKFAGGLGGFAGFMTQVGIPMAGVMAPLVAVLELAGGVLVLLGVGARWLGVLFVLEFLVAAFVVKLPNTSWDASRIDLMMLGGAIMLVLAGAGKASVDELLARRRAPPVAA